MYKWTYQGKSLLLYLAMRDGNKAHAMADMIKTDSRDNNPSTLENSNAVLPEEDKRVQYKRMYDVYYLMQVIT